ncbi:MAG: hypothetical protein ACRC24_07985 [Vibrionaceae bacterium]
MNITNNTNNLSVTTPLNLEQETSTALAVLNVTSSTQLPETLVTNAHTNAAVFDPANWSSLAQNLAQGQPSTPISPPQATSAGRRQQASETSPENAPPIVRRRARRDTTSTVTATDCKAGELIIKKDGNNYKCLKLSDAFPEKGVLMDPKELLSQKADSAATSRTTSSASKGTTYPQIKDLFGNSTESKQIHAEVLQRMIMTTNSALKADEKWRWQLYLNNSAGSKVDKEIFELSNLTRLLELDNEEFPDNWIFFRGDCVDDTAATNCTESATNTTNSTTNSTCISRRSYRPHYFNQTSLPANRTCANDTQRITFDDFVPVTSGENKKSPGPSQVYSNYTAWLAGSDIMWTNLRDRSLLDVFMIGLASGMSLVSIILLLVSCIRMGKRIALVDRLQSERNKENRAIKVHLDVARRAQEARDRDTSAQEARELGVLKKFNKYRFTDRRNYFGDKEMDLAALNKHHHQGLVRQAEEAFAQTQNPAGATASGSATQPDDDNDEPKPWTQRYLLPESAFEQGLDVAPPPYNIVDYIAVPVVGPVEANERFDLVDERRSLELVQTKLKAVHTQRTMLENKILTQEGFLPPKERRKLRELQTVEEDLHHERRRIERSIVQLETQILQRAYNNDVAGVTLLEEHPLEVLSRAAVMPARSDAEVELDKNLLAEQLQCEELPSYYDATQVSHRPARAISDLHASINAINAQKELKQKQQARQKILESAAAFDLRAEDLLNGTIVAEVAVKPSNKDKKVDSATSDVSPPQEEAKPSSEDEPPKLTYAEEVRQTIASMGEQLQLLQAGGESAGTVIDIPADTPEEASAEAQPLLEGQSGAITQPSPEQGGARAKTAILVSGGKTVPKKDKEQEKRDKEAQRLAYASANEARRATQEGVRQSLKNLIEGSVAAGAMQEISASTITEQSQKALEGLIEKAYDTGKAPSAADFVDDLVRDIEQIVTDPWQRRMEQVIDRVLNQMLPEDPSEARDYLNDSSCARKLNQRLAAAAAQVLQEQITPGVTPETVHMMLDTISQALANSLTLGDAQAMMQLQLEETEQRCVTQSEEMTSIQYYEKMASLQKAIKVKMETHSSLTQASQELGYELEETKLKDPTAQGPAVEEFVLAKSTKITAARERRIALSSEKINFYRPPAIEDEPKPHATQSSSQLERELLELKQYQLSAIGKQTAIAEQRLIEEETQQVSIMVNDRINADLVRRRQLQREQAKAFAATIPLSLRPQPDKPLSNKAKDKESRASQLIQLKFSQSAQSTTAQPPPQQLDPAAQPQAEQSDEQLPESSENK